MCGGLFREPPASVKQPGQEKGKAWLAASPRCRVMCRRGGCWTRRRAKQKAAAGLAVTCFYRQVTDWTEVAAMRKIEERKKHDRLSRLLSGGRKRFL